MGRVAHTPCPGSALVVVFDDGVHEYVTTPVQRVLKLAGREVYYVETTNSRYRMEVRSNARSTVSAIPPAKQKDESRR
jgi:hypothetical protein